MSATLATKQWAVGPASPYATFDAFAGDVEAVMSELAGGDGAAPAGALTRLRALLTRGRCTGRILDSFKERRAFQKELDALARVLEKMEKTPVEATLAPFDPTAERDAPPPPYPFDDLERRTLDTPRAPTAEEIRGYLSERAAVGELRLDDGLADELATQLAGDPEAWPLLAYTLRALHDELRQSGGNKLRRPAGSSTLDCRALLAQGAERALASHTARTRARLERALTALGVHATSRAPEHGRSRAELARRIGPDSDPALDLLEAARLVRPLADARGAAGLVLVHRSLAERWEPLAEWINTERDRRRRRARHGFLAAVAVAAAGLAYAFVVSVTSTTMAAADRLAGEANVQLVEAQRIEQGGVARSPDGSDPAKLELAAVEAAALAYRKANTPLTYTTLFNVVNAAAQRQARRSSPQASQTFIYRFGSGGATPALEIARDGAQQRFLPDGVQGTILQVVISPPLRHVAIAFRPADGGDDYINVYEWGDPAPRTGGPIRCEQGYAAGSIRFSTTGRVYTYECLERPRSIVDAIDAEAYARIEPIYAATRDDPVIFFDGPAGRDEYAISISRRGELIVRQLAAPATELAVFRIPALAALTPVAVAYSEPAGQAALLDRQGVITLYGQRGWLRRTFLAAVEDRPQLYVNPSIPAGRDQPLRWKANALGFTDSGRCLRLTYVGTPFGGEPPRESFRSETFMIDPRDLLALADALVRGEMRSDLSCDERA